MNAKLGRLFLWAPVMLLLDSPSAKAQEPLEIVSAQYGTDASSIDVTAQVRSLVRRNTLYVTVAPRILGVRDPMPGVSKVLRVQYQGWRQSVRSLGSRYGDTQSPGFGSAAGAGWRRCARQAA